DKTLVSIDELKNYPDNQTVLITTGSQGESMAALSRMANGTHRKVNIKPNDTIIFSSHPIPGNEKAVSRVMNELYRKGAQVVMQDVHVSGHACAEEIKLIYSIVRPKYAVPAHGEYKHRKAQANIAHELGYDDDHICLINSGDVLEFDEDGAKVVGNVQTGTVMIDGLGVGDVGNIVLRDRQKLADDGIIIVVMTLEAESGEVMAGPDIVTRGFVYVRDSEELILALKEVVRDSMEDLASQNIRDWNRIKNCVKNNLSDHIWQEMQRSPMIIPILMEV
ncbi:MAG: ribonuclease J, partial [Lachnospiraceae bacterium]|nr:ribonuclease J [Lachnospiraceae bacterium]